MTCTEKTIERIDGLYDMGRSLVERDEAHGIAVEYQFDVCRFDAWRRKVNDFLFTLGGCEDLYYQRFSQGVTRPHVRDLEVGLRLLTDLRDDAKKAGTGDDSEYCWREDVTTGMVAGA